jgi:hypothetical protein
MISLLDRYAMYLPLLAMWQEEREQNVHTVDIPYCGKRLYFIIFIYSYSLLCICVSWKLPPEKKKIYCTIIAKC